MQVETQPSAGRSLWAGILTHELYKWRHTDNTPAETTQKNEAKGQNKRRRRETE